MPLGGESLSPEWGALFGVLGVLTKPIYWVASAQTAIVEFMWESSSPMMGIVKLVVFLLPGLHAIAAMWC